MREKKFGKRCLTWVLVLMMTLSLLPVSALAEDGEARFYGKNVTSTYARDNTSVNKVAVQSTQVYTVGIIIEKDLKNVVVTLTGTSGTTGTYSKSVDRVSKGDTVSITGVPSGNYKAQATGVDDLGVAYKGSTDIPSYWFGWGTPTGTISNFEKDVNGAVTLSFSFNNPKKALDGQNYAFQNITAYLIAAADYTSGDTSKRYPLTLSSTGYMSAQVPANQEYKLVAEGWTYAAIDNGTRDLTVKHSFSSKTWTISQSYTDKDSRLSIAVPEESVSVEKIEANWVEVPVKIEDSGEAESYTVVIQDKRGTEYSAITTTKDVAIKIPAVSNASYNYTITVTSSDGRSISKDRYVASSFYNVKAESDGSVVTAVVRSDNPILIPLSNDYVTMTVNIYGGDKLVSSKIEKQAIDSIRAVSTVGSSSGIAALKKAELFVNNEKVAEENRWFFDNFAQYNIPANATVRADFYYEYTDAKTEYTVTIHHRFLDASGKVIKDEMSEERYHAGDVLNILKQTEHSENWISQATKKIEGYRNAGAWQISMINAEGREESVLVGLITIDRSQGIVDGAMPHSDIGITFNYSYIDNYIEYIANANDAVGEMYVDWCNSNETKTVKKINNGKDNYYSRSGYEFVNWNTKADGTGTAYNPGDSITLNGKPVTLYAQWKRNGGHHPSKPDNTVEIPDEDALGLNTDDHFAYIIGYPDGTVQPNGQITRAEATTIFFRLLTEESRSANLTKTNGYTDVAFDAWYNTAVSTMTKAGIVDGYPDGTFRPDAPITRAEMAKIISLFAKLDKSESRFSDIAGHWAEAYIRLAAGNGWIAGYPDGTFGPQRNITRAETATMINRVLDRVPSEESHLLSRGVMQIWPDANPGDWFYLAMQEATNSHDYERNAKWAAADEQWTALRETRDWKALEQ